MDLLFLATKYYNLSNPEKWRIQRIKQKSTECKNYTCWLIAFKLQSWNTELILRLPKRLSVKTPLEVLRPSVKTSWEVLRPSVKTPEKC